MYYVYLIVSEEGDKYIGFTEDPKKRLKAHNEGKSVFTRYQQWKIAYLEAYLVKKEALVREKRLKHDGRARRQLYERAKESIQNTWLL